MKKRKLLFFIVYVSEGYKYNYKKLIIYKEVIVLKKLLISYF